MYTCLSCKFGNEINSTVDYETSPVGIEETNSAGDEETGSA